MAYDSIDTLQEALSKDVFSHTSDSKKAAGRALGTMIEIISYYLLNEWGLTDSICIERGLKEYGNPEITHNVEFSLHPLLSNVGKKINSKLPITAAKILSCYKIENEYQQKNNSLLSKDNLLKNACTIAESRNRIVNAILNTIDTDGINIKVVDLYPEPYAMFECKRVGIEKGNKKGPQTIEKAKQGAYVAEKISSLQKIKDDNGNSIGIVYKDNNPIIEPYNKILRDIIDGEDNSLLKGFTLSIGIVSNHGNWFTNENQNKELRVLAQSYDWLLFLTDKGLAQFITDLIKSPSEEYFPIKQAFQNSYKEGKKINSFTKARMDLKAHQSLISYFNKNIAQIEGWFNIISPQDRNITQLKEDLYKLKNKNWEEIL